MRARTGVPFAAHPLLYMCRFVYTAKPTIRDGRQIVTTVASRFIRLLGPSEKRADPASLESGMAILWPVQLLPIEAWQSSVRRFRRRQSCRVIWLAPAFRRDSCAAVREFVAMERFSTKSAGPLQAHLSTGFGAALSRGTLFGRGPRFTPGLLPLSLGRRPPYPPDVRRRWTPACGSTLRCRSRNMRRTTCWQ